MYLTELFLVEKPVHQDEVTVLLLLLLLLWLPITVIKPSAPFIVYWCHRYSLGHFFLSVILYLCHMKRKRNGERKIKVWLKNTPRLVAGFRHLYIGFHFHFNILKIQAGLGEGRQSDCIIRYSFKSYISFQKSTTCWEPHI